MHFKINVNDCIKTFLFKVVRSKSTKISSSPSLQNKDRGGVGATSRGRRLVDLGVETGGFRDQGV